MSLPLSRNLSHVNGLTPISGDDFDALQDNLVGLFGLPFGDGSDGAATGDGILAVPGTTLAGGTYTATRDLFFQDLTLSGILNMAGYRLFVRGTLALTGTIHNNGTTGSVLGGGAAPAGTLKGGGAGGIAGGSGGTGTVSGAAGASVTRSAGGSGGAGGAAGAGGPGAAGTSAPPAATEGSYRALHSLLTGHIFGAGAINVLSGGAGGGGGGAADGTGGGGGGGGGGVVVSARVISWGAAASISAHGGDGEQSHGGTLNGGGGGGGGGYVFVVCARKIGTSVLNVLGGAGGAKQGTGLVGAAGSPGTAIEFNIGALPGAIASPPPSSGAGHIEQGVAAFDGSTDTLTVAFAVAFPTPASDISFIVPVYNTGGGIIIAQVTAFTVVGATVTGMTIQISDLAACEVRWKAWK
jgi:hypothetical protein